jgi:hypothetical protein
MTTLSDIRDRADADPVPVQWPNAFDRCAKDRRYLLQLLDAYQSREREARELLEAVLITDHEWVDRRTAWLAAPSPVSPPKGPVTP